MTEARSRARALPHRSKAALFAAGETSTTVVSVAAAAYAANTGTPGGTRC